MKLFKNKTFLSIVVVCVLLASFIIFFQTITLQKAHSTFENYYAFRGCEHLIQRTNDYGICKIANGQTIKIVKYQGKWYLDGDLPCKQLFCFN